MPNYNNAKIYKLWTPESDDIYIGSTCSTLCKRLSGHKAKNNHYTSKYLFENFSDVRIELLENYPCNDKKELYDKEAYYIKNNKCLNERIPNRSKKDYAEEHKEEVAIYQKKWRNENKDRIDEITKCIYVCECGCEFTRKHLPKHLKTEKHCNLIKNNI